MLTELMSGITGYFRPTSDQNSWDRIFSPRSDRWCEHYPSCWAVSAWVYASLCCHMIDWAFTHSSSAVCSAIHQARKNILALKSDYSISTNWHAFGNWEAGWNPYTHRNRTNTETPHTSDLRNKPGTSELLSGNAIYYTIMLRIHEQVCFP